MKTSLKLLLIGLLSSSLLACAGSDNLLKPEPLVNFTPTASIHKSWGIRTGGTDAKYLNLQIGQDKQSVYTVSYKGVIYDFDANSGSVNWKTKLDDDTVSGVTVGRNLAVVASSKGFLYVLNATNGDILWKKDIGNEVVGRVAIGNNMIVAKTVDGTVFALRANSGKQLWSYGGNAPLLILRGGSQPKIIGNRVIVGFSTGKLIALSLRDGSILWQQAIAEPEGGYPVQRMVDITVAPVIADGVAYIATYQGNIAAVELSNGNVLWNRKLSSYTGIALSGKSLFVTDASSHVWAFDTDDGGVLWQQKDLQGRQITAPAIIGDDLVVADAEGYIHFLSKESGKFVARERFMTDPIQANPKIVDNKIFILDTFGHLAAYQMRK